MTLKPFRTQDGLSIIDNSNLSLTQSTVGWITIYGPLINNDNDIEFFCVTVDTDGNSYFGGYDSNIGRAILVKFNPAGVVQWSSSFGSEGGAVPLRNIQVNSDIANLEVVVGNMLWLVDMGTGDLTATFAYSEGSAQPLTWTSKANLGGVPVLGGSTDHPTLGTQSVISAGTWSRSFGSSELGSDDLVQNLATVGSSLVVAVGYSNNTEGFTSDVATVTVFNSDGLLVWAKILNESDVNCRAVGVAATSTRIYTTHYNDDTSLCHLTCFDLSGTVVWQRTTDNNSREASNVVVDDQENVYWLVQAYWSEVSDDAYKIIKLDASGTEIWSRWAGNRNDCRLGLYQSLAVGTSGIFVAGRTDDTDNDYDTAFAMRLPLDGENTGFLGYYFWVEGDYTVDTSTATVSTWNVIPESATITSDTVSGWDSVSYSTSNNIEKIRDQSGGRLIFGDGSQQMTATVDIPQLRTGAGTRRLALGDRGKHIYCTNYVTIMVPYDYDVSFPIGSTIVVVNNSGGNISIIVDGGGTSLIVPGLGSNSSYVLNNQGMATLLKVDVETWFMTGATLEVD